MIITKYCRSRVYSTRQPTRSLVEASGVKLANIDSNSMNLRQRATGIIFRAAVEGRVKADAVTDIV